MIVFTPDMDTVHYENGSRVTPAHASKWYAGLRGESKLVVTPGADIRQVFDEIIEFDLYRLFGGCTSHRYLHPDGSWKLYTFWFDTKKQLMAAMRLALQGAASMPQGAQAVL